MLHFLFQINSAFSKTWLLPELQQVLSYESLAVFLHTPVDEKGPWGPFYQLRQVLAKGRHYFKSYWKHWINGTCTCIWSMNSLIMKEWLDFTLSFYRSVAAVISCYCFVARGGGGIVSVVCSIVLSKGCKPFLWDVTRAATCIHFSSWNSLPTSLTILSSLMASMSGV